MENSMKDQNKSKAQLITELEEMRRRISLYEKSENVEIPNSEERFHELAELLPDAVYETDTSLNITYANQSAFAMFGYSAEELARGMNGTNFFIPEERARIKRGRARQFKGEKIGPAEYRALRKDGLVFPVILHSSLRIQESKVVGTRGIIVDMTALKKQSRH